METVEATQTPAAPSSAPPSLTVAVADTVSGIIDAMADVDATIAGLLGLRAELAHQAAVWSGVADPATPSASARDLRMRSLRAEIACALRLPERTAEKLMLVGEALACDLPATLAALKAGEISYRHAQTMVDNTEGLDADARARLEDTALPFARTLTAAKFEHTVRTVRELAHPETMVERARKAATDRELQYTPARDGMAWLSAYLPAADALAGYNRCTEIGRSLQPADADRTLTQLRADVFRDLTLDGEPTEGATGIRPQVFITVPVLTLLGYTLPDGCDEPGTLDGYGPIDAETARALAAHAPSFIRILTHPETGAVLSVGRDSYPVPKDLKNWLRTRDKTCRFPGCSRAAADCDIDHTYAWADGGHTGTTTSPTSAAVTTSSNTPAWQRGAGASPTPVTAPSRGPLPTDAPTPPNPKHACGHNRHEVLRTMTARPADTRPRHPYSCRGS